MDVDVLTGVQAAVCSILRDRERPIPEMNADTPLFEAPEESSASLALDSLDAVDLFSLLEARFEVELPPGLDIENVRTLGDVVAIVRNLTSTCER